MAVFSTTKHTNLATPTLCTVVWCSDSHEPPPVCCCRSAWCWSGQSTGPSSAANPHLPIYKGTRTLCYKYIMGHCSILSLWLSSTLHHLPYSPLCFRYSQPPDFSHRTLHWALLVPALFLFLVYLHGMTFPFLSSKTPLWPPWSVMEKHIFSQNYRPATFSVPCCCLHPSEAYLLPVLSCGN